MSSPKKRTRPAVAGKSPVMTLNKVVLPAPLAPITARRSPAATENETSSMACSAPNVRVTPSSSRASPVASGVCGRSEVTRAMALLSYDLLGAVRHVARAETHLVELLLGEVQPLVDLRQGL